jgi:hypothetical protein
MPLGIRRRRRRRRKEKERKKETDLTYGVLSPSSS